MDKELSLEEKIIPKSQQENISNIKLNLNNKNIDFKKKGEYNLINNKPQKRTRDYSLMEDLEDEDEIMNESNNDNKKNKNKKRKVPLIKLVERITLNDPDKNKNDKSSKNKNKSKKKRGIKIFSDMSISEISNNLFKNYYPCILPEYHIDQISHQIIENQLDKLISNFLQEKKEEINNKKIIINQNMDYLRKIAEKQGEWIDSEKNYDVKYDDNKVEEQENKSYDSNSENNSKNSYPEDESIEEEEREKNFEDEYNDYPYEDNDD